MSDTKTKILNAAESLTQLRGFNGFSYLDLSAEVGIKTSSIHYHFKTKSDLATALVERVHETHSKAFNDLSENTKSPDNRLKAVIRYFQDYVNADKYCMCGMMLAELYFIEPEVRERINEYFKDFRLWLTKQFKEKSEKNPKRKALAFLSALEGSLLFARLEGDSKIVSDALQDFLKKAP